MKECKMKIWKIGVLVGDLEEAEELYTKVLGMEVVSRGPRSVFLDAGDVRLELIKRLDSRGGSKEQ